MMYRSKKLLQAAKDAPVCMGCGKSNHGDVVAAHANWSEYGKGMGMKAHDWAVAYLCHECHARIDQGQGSKQDKREAWQRAHVRTLEWLFDTGVLSA